MPPKGSTNSTINPPEPRDNELLILGLALGSLLVSILFVLFYCCCRRFVCSGFGTEVYSIQTNGQTIPKSPSSQAVFLVTPDSSQSNVRSLLDADPERNLNASELSDNLSTVKMPMFKSTLLPPTIKTPAERAQKRVSPRFNRLSTISRAISSPPIYLDKRSITADMLNPGKTNSKREIVLFKAPSFSE